MDFIQEENKVMAISRYHGESISVVARCGDDDEFNLELGKAIARVRLETKIRKNEMRELLNTKHALEQIPWTDLNRRMITHFLDHVNKEINIQRHYMANQKRLIDVIERSDLKRWSGMQMDEIVRTAFDEVMARQMLPDTDKILEMDAHDAKVSFKTRLLAKVKSFWK